MFTTKEEFKEEFTRRVLEKYGRSVELAHKTEHYMVLGEMVRDVASTYWKETKDKIGKEKQLIYFSMEFLLGRMMKSNLNNLNIYSIVEDGLKELNISLDSLMELEKDAGLGNGGLGRLAACFMDSLPTDGYVGHGNSIRYQFGFFKQLIKDGKQVEVPDQWLTLGNVWEIRKPKHAVDVCYYGHVEPYQVGNRTMYRLVGAEHVRAVPYDMPMPGYHNGIVNSLRLWSAEPSEEVLPNNKSFYTYLNEIEQLCHGLYPDDSTEQGKLLRLRQQYFFVSAGMQAIVKQHLRMYPNMDNFSDHYVIQLNDTHPILAIPELMRILLDVYFYEWDDAWNIVTNTFAYTNHTVMAEALEKWPVHYIQRLLPRIYTIIEEINRRFILEARLKGLEYEKIDRMQVIKDGQIHMSKLGIIGSRMVNGVAKLHTEILKHDVFKDFYDYYPNKFTNVTNGISPRRFMMYANKQLDQLITSKIGDQYHTNMKDIEQLLKYQNDENFLRDLGKVKLERKQILAKYIKEHNDIDVDVNSIFDIQVKRLHAYKRQMLNVFHIIYLYKQIKEGKITDMVPRTFIFGAKAAPSYVFAKNVIELILAVANKINNDPEVSKFIKVVFIENYDVSKAEIIMPACDVSEQISTAGKEASGTGNMKFMMNGAVTLGTLDGANVEISELVGEDNCVIFGMKDYEVDELRKSGRYSSYYYYNNDEDIRYILDSLINGTWSKVHDKFQVIYNEIMLKNDEYFILADLPSYVETQQKINELYKDQLKWQKMCLVNIAKSYYFSSDRTINDYVDRIWHLKKVS